MDEIAHAERSVVEPRAEIVEAYVFGSAARGDAARHSDVDVAVYLDAADSMDRTAELGAELMRALRTRRVDVVILNRAPML